MSLTRRSLTYGYPINDYLMLIRQIVLQFLVSEENTRDDLTCDIAMQEFPYRFYNQIMA